MKRLGQALVVTIAVVLGVGTLAVPANASVAQGYIIGTGTPTDDWNDEGPMSSTQHANSPATGLWQFVLYADGATESNGTAYDLSDIDWDFGPNTTFATKSWQKAHGVPQTGAADTATLSKADKKLVTVVSSRREVQYNGSAHTVGFLLNTEGSHMNDVYAVETLTADACWWPATYDTLTPYC
jgi:hypothetical protein